MTGQNVTDRAWDRFPAHTMDSPDLCAAVLRLPLVVSTARRVSVERKIKYRMGRRDGHRFEPDDRQALTDQTLDLFDLDDDITHVAPKVGTLLLAG